MHDNVMSLHDGIERRMSYPDSPSCSLAPARTLRGGAGCGSRSFLIAGAKAELVVSAHRDLCLSCS